MKRQSATQDDLKQAGIFDDPLPTRMNEVTEETEALAAALDYGSPSSHMRPALAPNAKAAFICAILGIVIPFLGLFGLIGGIIALRRIRKQPDRYRGTDYAVAAIGLYVFQLVLHVALFFMMFTG